MEQLKLNNMSRALIALVLLFGISHLSHSANIKPLPAEIDVRIALPEASICLESKSLSLEVYITNISSKEMTISKEWTLKMSSFDVVCDQESKNTRIATLSIRGDPFPGGGVSHSWFSLSPGASNRYVTSLGLSNREFFTGPSVYRLMVRCIFYHRQPNGEIREIAIDSNNSLFELTSCPPQLGK